MRKPRTPEGPDITGKTVIYRSRPDGPAERGIVKRMGTGKLPCAFVIFDSDPHTPKLCYIKDLEIQ